MDLWNYYDGDLKYPNLINHSHEKEIAKTKSDWAFEYVSNYGEDKELEPIITTSAKYSFMYADQILNGPFELGEPAIAKSAEYSYNYANHVLNGPFPLGEKAISTSPYYSFKYSMLLEKRFKLGEPAIATSELHSVMYAKVILKGPFKLGEPAIARMNARMKQYTNIYTNEVLKKDFYLDGKLICKYEG